jgi:hypothetical protein
MIPAMTSRYHDWGIFALGFSAAILIELGMQLLTCAAGGPPSTISGHLVWGVAVGPLIVICLLLRATLPHRIALAAGAIALTMYLRGL